MSLKQAEAGVEAGLEKVKTAQLGLSAAGHRLASSSYGVTMEEADEKKEAATKKKEALEAKAKQIKGYVDKVIEVGQKVALALAAPGAGAASAAEGEAAAPAGGSTGAIEKGGAAAAFIADKIVDLVYGGRIEAAQKAIDAAVAEFKAAKKGKAQEDWLAGVGLPSKMTEALPS